ncbi:MAG: DNA polymerase III subunit alpha [Candidatus Saccharimonadales bacterium]
MSAKSGVATKQTQVKASRLTAAGFVHLHNHTQYSLLDGLTKIPDLIDFVKQAGMSAIAKTDHGTLSGSIEFYKEAKANGIKPIIGLEAYVAARTINDRDPAKDKQVYHLTILAMSNIGYSNLMRLSTIANLEGLYYKPRVDHALLEEYNKGLIVLSGCMSGELGDNLRQGQHEKAKEIATWYKKIFGNRYYLEIQDHGHPEHPSKWDEQTLVNEELLKLGKELDIPCVVTCDAHYLHHADQEAHEILLCVQTGSFLTDKKRMSLSDFELNVTEPSEVIGRWGKTHPEVISNTKLIANRCQVEIKLDKILIANFPVPKGETEKSLLDKLVFRGLAWRHGGIDEAKASTLSLAQAKKTLPKPILQRADYELSIIGRMDFNGYFLIIADFINWGKNQGIVFGPGRGSAASSIVSYALRITELDPLKYDLQFERFLNPDRISLPDFDIDIQDTRRDEVIQYCADKYGTDRVANIVTYGRMAARNAVRDVARVLQVPYIEADRLAKMIPQPVQGRHIPLKLSIENDPDLKQEYATNDTAKRVFDLAIQLEGTIRSHGVHAAGVVIAPDDIVQFVPLEKAQKGVIATQYSMGPIEDLGLLKMDFLGLSNLTIIKNAQRIIKKVYGQDIDLEKLSLDDTKTLQIFRDADTAGVFQFESAGMRRYLRELQPTTFEDIIAMGALYRPGPMQFIDDFIARKHGLKKIEYLHPKMEDALKTTYGVLVYQEQVMQISKDLCGFTGSQADTLRKAIGKKNMDVLLKMKIEFIEGAMKNGAERELMEKFWKQLEDFAAYCFNKAHAACYALISYWTAYLRAHYPAALMAALMTSDFNDTDRLAIDISACKHMGINVLPPDVNESFLEFAVVPIKELQIRFSLEAIKNVGQGAAEEIIKVRSEGGPFVDLADFLKRVDLRIVNKKALESLIKAGSLDRFVDRSSLLFNLDMLMAYSARLTRQTRSGQVDLFGALEEVSNLKSKLTLQAPTEGANIREQLQWERQLLGLYLSQNPLDPFTTILSEQTVPINVIGSEHDGRVVTIGGNIIDVRTISTKNGQKMAFAKIEDEFGEVEAIIFPGVLQQTTDLWERDKVIILRGKVNATDRSGNIAQEIKVIADSAHEITHEEAISYKVTGKKPNMPKSRPQKITKSVIAASSPQKAARVYIRLAKSDDDQLLLSLKRAIDEQRGESEVVLVLGDDDAKQIIRLPSRMNSDEDSLKRLQSLVGPKNIVLK